MLRFASQLQINNLPDEQLENNFEVIMPALPLGTTTPTSNLPTALGRAISSAVNAVSSLANTTSYTPIVEEIVFGVRNFKNTTRRIRTNWVNIPEDIENYHEVSITMFCSAGMLTQQYLAVWKSMIFNVDGEYYNPMTYYKKNIEVFFYGPGGSIGMSQPAVSHFTLQGCYPVLQDDYKLGYSQSPKRLRLTQRFRVDRVVASNDLAQTAMRNELLTSPQNILNDYTNKLLGARSASQFDSQTTYN